jgi:hypothetical protein
MPDVREMTSAVYNNVKSVGTLPTPLILKRRNGFVNSHDTRIPE